MPRLRSALKNFCLASALFLLTLAASAQAIKAPPSGFSPTVPITGVGNSTTGVVGLFCIIASWWLAATVFLSIIFGVWAGTKYVLGEGEAAKNTEARHMLQYSLIGVAIGIVALGIPAIASRFLGSGTIGGICPFL